MHTRAQISLVYTRKCMHFSRNIHSDINVQRSKVTFIQKWKPNKRRVNIRTFMFKSYLR